MTKHRAQAQTYNPAYVTRAVTQKPKPDPEHHTLLLNSGHNRSDHHEVSLNTTQSPRLAFSSKARFPEAALAQARAPQSLGPA